MREYHAQKVGSQYLVSAETPENLFLFWIDSANSSLEAIRTAREYINHYEKKPNHES